MASGTISLNSTRYDMFQFQAKWSATANNSANTSDFSITYQVKFLDTTYIPTEYRTNTLIYIYHNMNYVSDRSTSYSKETAGEVDISLTGWQDIKTITYSNLPHSSIDGTANAFLTEYTILKIGAVGVTSTIQVGAVPPATEDNYSKYVMLFDTISQGAYITSAPNFTELDNPTIKFTNPHGASNLYACISLNGVTDDIAYRRVSGTSYTFNLTAAEREVLINAVTSGSSTTIRFYIRSTKSGTTYYKSVGRTFSLTDALPNITPAVVDMNTVTNELTGNPNALIRYCSTAAVQSNAIAKYNGTIASEKITCGNQVEEDGLAAFENIETNIFTFEAKDSRGNKATLEYVAEPFIEYFLPTCNQKLEIEFDTATETEAKVKIEISGSWFNGNFGAADNELKVEFRHKSGNSEWTGEEWISVADVIWEIVAEENTYKVKGTVSGLSYDEEHTFQCRVTDKLRTTETSEYPITLIPLFDWGKEDFVFNVPVEIKGDLTVTGSITIGGEGSANGDSIIDRGTEAMGTNGTWYWEKWSSGKAVCWGTRNFGNMAVSSAWGANGWYESTGFTQDFPTGLFVAEPDYLQISAVKASNALIVSQAWGEGMSATNTGTFSLARPSSMTVQQVYLSFHAIGRWK